MVQLSHSVVSNSLQPHGLQRTRLPCPTPTPRQEEKGTTEDEMVGWHHQLNGHEFEQAPGVGEQYEVP